MIGAAECQGKGWKVCGHDYTAATAIDGHVLPRRYILPQGIRHWEVRPTAWFATLACTRLFSPSSVLIAAVAGSA